MMTMWMDLGGMMLSEIHQRNILNELIYMWNLKWKHFIKQTIEKKRSDSCLPGAQGGWDWRKVIKWCEFPVG